ncbi:unnamed protein product [Arctogadus glacialis]
MAGLDGSISSRLYLLKALPPQDSTSSRLFLLKALPPQALPPQGSTSSGSTSSRLYLLNHQSVSLGSENCEGADLGSGPPSLINKANNVEPDGLRDFEPHIVTAHL